MKRFTYLLALILVILLPIVVSPAIAYGAAQSRIIINGQEVAGLDVPPQVLNNRVMVPARNVFEHLGGTFEWNNELRQTTIHYSGNTLAIIINDTTVQINGETYVMDVPPVIIDNHTMIPLRILALAFGFEVDWDSTGRVAYINTQAQEGPVENYAEQEEEPYKPEETLPLTRISTILTPSDTDAMAYIIVATGEIYNVNYFLLPDNRLVVDIYNSEMDVFGQLSAYGPVRDVRTSQRNHNITRVVFELTASTEFSVALSYDRHEVTVAFAVNNIYIAPTSRDDLDIFTIRGDFQPSISLCAANYPHYLDIYLGSAYIMDVGEFFHDGIFVFNYVVEQRNGGWVIRVYMHNGWPAISLANGRNYISVVLHQGLQGIRYDFWSHELRISRDVIPYMDIDNVRRNNEHMSNRYTITLPVSGSGLEIGSLSPADSFINSVIVRRTSAGYAQLIFYTSRVMAFSIYETPDEYIIRVSPSQYVHPFIIVIDPGHGGRDPGTVHHGVRESDVVLAISQMVAERLSHHPNIQVYMTRYTDVAVTHAQRTALANQVADLFISIHVNAVRNRPHVTGIETWYLPHDREVNFTSRQFAQNVQGRMINATGAENRGVRNTSNFIVLRYTRMPAILVEVGFMTNAEDAARLATTAYQEILAQAIYEGILESFAQYGPRR